MMPYFKQIERLCCFFGFILLLILPGCTSRTQAPLFTQEEANWIKNNKDSLTFVVEKNYPPFSFIDKEGKFRGVTADYLELIQQKSGLDIQAGKGNTLAHNLKLLKEKKADLTGSLSQTPNRTKYLYFTETYIEIPTVVIVRKNNQRISTIADLNGMHVGIGQAYGIEEYLNFTHPEIKYTSFPDDLIALHELSFGKIDAVIMDIASASWFIQHNKITNLQIACNAGYTYKLSFATRNDMPQLTGILNKIIASIPLAKKKEINNKWIDYQNEYIWQKYKTYILLGVFALLCIVLIISFWNRSLKKLVAIKTKELQQEIKEHNLAEEKLSLLTNLTFEGIIIHKNGIITDCNRALSKMTGYTKAELLQKDVVKLLVPEQYQPIVYANMAKKHANAYEIFAKKKDGTLFPIEIEAKNISDKNSTKYRVTAIRDITERKKVQNALIESEVRFKSIFENTGAASCLLAKDSIIIKANERFAEIAGYSLEEIENKKKWEEFVHPDHLKKMQEQHNLRRLEPNKAMKKYEFCFIDRTKKTKDILLFVDIIPDTELSIASLLDITERKSAELKILKSREDYESLFESAADGILVGESHGIIIDANNRVCSISQYSKNELIGKNISILFSQQTLDEKPLRYDLVQEGHNITKERLLKQKNGNAIPIEMSSNKLPDGRMQSIIRDISDRIKAKEELIAAKNAAEESNRLKSAFLANISHETRTPMNGIIGFIELLKSPDLSREQQMKYIRIIEESSERMLTLINNIMDISKIQSGDNTVYFSEIHLNVLISDLHNQFRPEAAKKGPEFQFIPLLSDFKTYIHSDYFKLYTILNNLLRNAFKYTHSGSIHFGFEPIKHKEETTEGIIQFFVRDTGIGIPNERQEAIFERFIQADIEDRDVYEGAGLGLTIAKAYVEMLGGTIWVESTEDKGSTFYFTLPLQNKINNESDDQNNSPGTILDTSTKNIKILIAEDDKSSRELLVSIFKNSAREIIEVSSGEEAIRQCRLHHDIDLIMMDVKMPGMNGYEAVQKIRLLNKTTCIIVQTAYALLGDEQKAYDAGCNAFISKPIKISQLQRLLKKHLT